MNETTADAPYQEFLSTGSAEALGRAFDSIAPTLLRYAASLVQDEDLAADLLQETFLLVAASKTEPQAGAAVFPWMCGIIRNLVRRHHREVATRKPDPERLSLKTSTSPVDALERKQVRETIESAIQSLPDPYREVLHLHIEQDLSPESIAAELGREVDTVYKQITRGKTRLQQSLPKDLLLLAVATIAASCATARSGSTSDVQETPPRSPFLLAGVAAMLIAICAWIVWPASGPVHEVAAAPDEAPRVAEKPAVPLEPKRTRSASNEPDQEALAADGIELTCTWEHNGLPAAGLSLRLDTAVVHPRTPFESFEQRWRHAVTDTRGVAVFTQVPLGDAHVLLDDGITRAAILKIHGRKHRRVDLTIPKPAMTFRGTIRDESANPIANAAIWLSISPGSQGPGYVAGYSDENGHYEVPAFRRDVFLWVRAPGYRASTMSRFLNSTAEVKSDATLSPEGKNSLRVAVVDQDGRPLPANLAVFQFAPGGMGTVAPSWFGRTKDDGSFTIPDQGPGRFTLVVKAKGHTTLFERFLFKLVGDEPLTFQLKPNTSLNGVVHGDRPPGSEYAYVDLIPAVSDVPPGALFYSLVGTALTADGHFSFPSAGVGPHSITVFAHGKIDSTQRIEIRADGSSVADLWWIARQQLTGQLVKHDGTPLPHTHVSVEPDGFASRHKIAEKFDRGVFPSDSECHRHTHADAEGKFAFGGLPVARYRISVYLDRQTMIPIYQTTVGASAKGPGIIVLPRESCTRAGIKGRIAQASEIPGFPKGLFLKHETFPHEMYVGFDNKDGHFSVESLPPGRYELLVVPEFTPDVCGCAIKEFELSPGQQTELGTLQLDATGTLIIDPPAWSTGSLSIHTLSGIEVSAGSFDSRRNQAPRMQVYPGTYELRLVGFNFVFEASRFTVRSGAKTTLTPTLVKAQRCVIKFMFKGKARASTTRAQVFDEGGTCIHTQTLPLNGVDDHCTLTLALPAGRYRVDGLATFGAKGTADVVVGDDVEVTRRCLVTML